MRRLLWLALVFVFSCVRAAPASTTPVVEAEVAPPDAGPNEEAVVDAGVPPAAPRAWVAPQYGEVPRAADFGAACHTATDEERAAETERRFVALGRALQPRGLTLLRVQRVFQSAGQGQLFTGPSGEQLLGVFMGEFCGPVEPPMFALTSEGTVVMLQPTMKARRTTTVAPCEPPRWVCPPGCGVRPMPTSFAVEVPPGTTLVNSPRAVRFELDEAVEFAPPQRYRHDCPPPP